MQGVPPASMLKTSSGIVSAKKSPQKLESPAELIMETPQPQSKTARLPRESATNFASKLMSSESSMAHMRTEEEQQRRKQVLDHIYSLIERRGSEKTEQIKQLMLQNKDRLSERDKQKI